MYCYGYSWGLSEIQKQYTLGNPFFYCKDYDIMIPHSNSGTSWRTVVRIQVLPGLLRNKSHLRGSSQFSDCICYNHLYFISVFGVLLYSNSKDRYKFLYYVTM